MKTQDKEVAELIERCRKSNPKAEFQLYKKLYPTLYTIAGRYRQNKNDIIESLNNAFVNILMNIEKKNPKVPFCNWFRRVAINSCIDDIRKSRRSQNLLPITEEVLEVRSSHWNPEDEICAEEIKETINKLPTVQAMVFNLFIVDGYSHKEIGEILDMKENTSKWHLREARKKLQKHLKHQMSIRSLT